ncbi:GNAT family N-acetyltransferase [Paenibacillus phocaensis]|uniref:GNAT family N-acetyltransferase n=1 Tax=Paenibacillus phocaensis TaxID=1776378 RepID=UPI0018E24F15
MKYFTIAMYEQMQIRGYWVFPDSVQELEADKAWYVEQGRDYEEEANQMYEFIKPLMLKHLPQNIHPKVLDGSLMTSKWPKPKEAAWIRQWNSKWDVEWKRRCNEYNDKYEKIKHDLPAGVRQLRENIRFHDAQIEGIASSEEGGVEIVLKEIAKEQATRITFQDVRSVSPERFELVQGSVCLYEEIDWIEPHAVEFQLLLNTPGEGLLELSLIAGGVTIDSIIQEGDVLMNHTPLIVRQAELGDLEPLAQLFDEYRLFYEQASNVEGARRFLEERLGRRESVVLLAIEPVSGNAIGFTQLYPSYSSISMKRVWILNDLYVREEYRSRGAAKLLLEAAKSHARQTDAKGLELSTAITNTRAQHLYERSGYERDTEFYHYFLSL